MSTRRTAAAVTAVAALTLAGCADKPPAKHTAAPPPSPSVSTTAASPIPTASSTPPPSPTPSVHPLGQQVTGPNGLATATVYAYKQPVATSATRPSQAGYEWGAADVQVCAVHDEIGVSHGPWALVYADNTTIEPSSIGYQQFPLPEYPWDEKKLQPGRCVRGWITFPAPKGKRPTMVEYTPAEDPPTDWQVS